MAYSFGITLVSPFFSIASDHYERIKEEGLLRHSWNTLTTLAPTDYLIYGGYCALPLTNGDARVVALIVSATVHKLMNTIYEGNKLSTAFSLASTLALLYL